MRLIDVDDLIDFIDMGHLRNPLESCFSERDVVDMLESRLTVDAVPVVRCKDCKHWKFAQHINDNLCHRFDGDPWIPTEPNDFCSYGVRKEGADNG